MVDIAKRNTLTLLSGSALITAMPSLAKGISPTPAAVLDSPADSMVPLSTRAAHSAEISISIEVDEQATLTLTNHSDSLIVVRHVHPGIVHAGERAFDINAPFKHSAYAIGAGRSRVIKIESTQSTQAETSFPRHLYANKPQKIVHVTANSANAGQLVNSTRSYYA